MTIVSYHKNLVAGLMISVFVFLISSGSVMNLWFYLGNNSFEQAFCENLDKPEKSCHGSCKMKKINKAPSSKENFKAEDAVLPMEPNFSWMFNIDIFQNENGKDITLFQFDIFQSVGINYLADHFHPPEI